MNAWVLLLRGVNVGGNSQLPMESLREILATLGVRHVTTLIQSGNAVFTGIIDARGFGELIEDEIKARHGFRPRALVLAAETFAEIVASYPFAEAGPKTGHIWFLARPATPDPEALDKAAAETERFALTERALYLFAPDGIGRSKLANGAEKLIGAPATARNLNTCAKLVEMLAALED